MKDLLKETLKPLSSFLEKTLPTISENWWQECVVSKLTVQQTRVLEAKNISSLDGGLDLAALLGILDKNWHEISYKEKWQHEVRNWIKEMQTIRNLWAHRSHSEPSSEDIYRDLDTLERFLKAIQANKGLIDKVQKRKASLIEQLTIEKPVIPGQTSFMADANLEKQAEEEIDVLAFVYIAQNIRSEGVLKKNVENIPKKYLEAQLESGTIIEPDVPRWARYLGVLKTTSKGNELIQPVIVERLENATPQIKSILDSFPEGVLRYLIEQVALSDFDEGRSLKDRSEEKNFRNYNEYAFSLLNDDRLKSFRDDLFNEFEDMGLAVKVNDYVGTRGGEIRGKYFVLAPELIEFLKEYIYGRKYKKPLFPPLMQKTIAFFDLFRPLAAYSTSQRNWFENEGKTKGISGNEIQGIVNELVKEGLLTIKNDQLCVSDKRAYRNALEEMFIKPVVDYLLAKQPIVQETPPTASVEGSRIEGKKPNKIEAGKRQIPAVSQETSSQEGVLVGFECGTGQPVRIIPAHLFIAGLTQKAGKTTTLEALVKRSGYSAISFITKPGEKSFTSGEYHKPFFQAKTEWRVIEKLFESLLDEKIKDVRPKLIELCKSEETIQAMKENIDIAVTESKGTERKSLILLQAYFEDLFKALEGREYTDNLNLKPGINVMDLAEFDGPIQNYIINSVLSEVLNNCQSTIVIIPEAWKFIPQSKRTPCKYSVEQLIRQGAVKKNFVWFDSQDIANVDKSLLKSVSVWLLGLQTEKNEVEHTIEQIPLPKKQRPAEHEIMHLKLGEFFVCTDGWVKKAYIMPHGMEEKEAIEKAKTRRPFVVDI